MQKHYICNFTVELFIIIEIELFQNISFFPTKSPSQLKLFVEIHTHIGAQCITIATNDVTMVPSTLFPYDFSIGRSITIVIIFDKGPKFK